MKLQGQYDKVKMGTEKLILLEQLVDDKKYNDKTVMTHYNIDIVNSHSQRDKYFKFTMCHHSSVYHIPTYLCFVAT